MRFTPFLAAALLAPCLLLTVPPVHAGLIETGELLAPAAVSSRERVDAFLAREEIQRELEAYGVSPANAQVRVAGLTEAEVQELASRIDSLPAGGDIGVLELLLIILIIVLLV